MCLTTRQLAVGAQKKLGDIPTTDVCARSDGSREITIRLFDSSGAVTESEEVRTELETFLNGLAATSVDAGVAAMLSAITFRVTYETNEPELTESYQVSVNEFPVYFVRRGGPFRLTSEKVKSLVEAHKIPDPIYVYERDPDISVPKPFDLPTYRDIEENWRAAGVLGFGFPSTYLGDPTQKCRKVGLVKVGVSETEDVPGYSKEKNLAILRHELGHMFGLRHKEGTVMDENYETNANYTQYTDDQLWVIAKILTFLTQT